MSGTPGRTHHGQKMGTWDLPTYQPSPGQGRGSSGSSRRRGGRQASTLSSQIAALRAANAKRSSPLASVPRGIAPPTMTPPPPPPPTISVRDVRAANPVGTTSAILRWRLLRWRLLRWHFRWRLLRWRLSVAPPRWRPDGASSDGAPRRRSSTGPPTAPAGVPGRRASAEARQAAARVAPSTQPFAKLPKGQGPFASGGGGSKAIPRVKHASVPLTGTASMGGSVPPMITSTKRVTGPSQTPADVVRDMRHAERKRMQESLDAKQRRQSAYKSMPSQAGLDEIHRRNASPGYMAARNSGC